MKIPLYEIRIKDTESLDPRLSDLPFMHAMPGISLNYLQKEEFGPDPLVGIYSKELAELRCMELHDWGFDAYLTYHDPHEPTLIRFKRDLTYTDHLDNKPLQKFVDPTEEIEKIRSNEKPFQFPKPQSPMVIRNFHGNFYFDFGFKTYNFYGQHIYDANFLRWAEIQSKILEKLYTADTKNLPDPILQAIYRYDLIQESCTEIEDILMWLEETKHRKQTYLANLRRVIAYHHEYMNDPHLLLSKIGVLTVEEHYSIAFTMLDVYRLLCAKYSDPLVMHQVIFGWIPEEDTLTPQQKIQRAFLSAQKRLLEVILSCHVQSDRFHETIRNYARYYHAHGQYLLDKPFNTDTDDSRL